MLIGQNRAEVQSLAERLAPKRRGAEAYARDVNAGTVDDHLRRAERLAAAGVDTMIVSLPNVTDDDAIARLDEIATQLP